MVPRLEARVRSYAGVVFNLSGTEVVFLLVAGLVVLGPERLPGVIRSVGRVYSDVRRAAQGVERELSETLGAPINEIRGTARSLTDELEGTRRLFGVPDDEPSPPMRPEKSADPSQSPSTTTGAGEGGSDA